ncbi:unnamed protein product [Lactuca saligna]|uniref:Clp1 N-terminal domain-containing protein n=1 Tax=Lactuca saligna TaxID=75948 RepID=A0AA35VDN5_LACSI|nr:unnamed protein product [Lactuca saligna]
MAPFGLRALPSPKSHVNRHNITKIRLMGSIRLFWLHKVVVIFNFVYVLQHLLFSVTEPQLRTKPSSVSDVVDAPEILAVIGKIPFLSEFMNSLYECQYESFFSAFAGITEHINLDRELVAAVLDILSKKLQYNSRLEIFEGNCINKQKHCWNIKSIMEYEGTPLGPPEVAGSSPVMKQVKLEKESELRIEVNFNSSLHLRLLNGTAEIFGTEMPPENWLIFPPRMKFDVNS